MRTLDTFTQGRVIEAKSHQKSDRSIAKDLGIPKSTVSDTILRYKRTGSALDRPGSKKTVLGSAECRRLKRTIKANNEHPWKGFAEQMGVGVDTARNKAKQMDLKKRVRRESHGLP